MVRNWLIQSSDIRRNNDEIRGLLDTLDAADVPWTDFGMVHYTSQITNWEDLSLKERYFPYGSTKMMRVLTNPLVSATDVFVGANPMQAILLLALFREGLYYDADAFDQTKPWATAFIKEHMLNGGRDAQHWFLHGLADSHKTNTYTRRKFVKPAADLKLFTGGVMEIGETFNDFLARTQVDGNIDDHRDDVVIMSDAVDILAEWRFFVVDEAVVAYSQYRKHGQLVYHSYVPPYVVDYAEYLATLYQPAKAFVMDVCLTAHLDLLIVEYNCLNCSGLYHANVTALAKALDKL